MALDNVRYDAFISYRHCELDSFISENLHKKLESYKMPRSVVAKIPSGRQSVERIFRDEAELPLSGNLSDPITTALDNSEFLIVICTPRLRESQWCAKEIETFVATHDREHVLLVLAEGEPDESFPEILLHEERTVKDANGNDITVTVDREPLAADCRGEDNRERLKKLDDVVLKLYAAIFGLNYDDLRRRHHEREVRRRIAIASAAFAIVIVFALTCLGFMLKISAQSKVIADKYAGAMASASEDLMSKGLSKDAIYAARSVLPEKESDGYNKEAYEALTTALAPYETASRYYPYSSFKTPENMWGFVPGKDGRCICFCDDHCEILNMDTSEELRRIDSDHALFLGDGVIYINDNSEAVFEKDDGSDSLVVAGDAMDLYGTGDIALVFTYKGITAVRQDGKSSDISLDSWWEDGGDHVADISFAEDGNFAAFALCAEDGVHAGAVDLKSGKITLLDADDNCGEPAVATDGKVLYLYHEEEEDKGIAGIITSTDLSTGKVTATRRLSGYGFYDILCDDEGAFVVSDRLSYRLDKDLEDVDVISGYMDAVCTYACDGGYVILDRTGTFFTTGVLSKDSRVFELYAHDEGIVTHARYDRADDRLYVRFRGLDRISMYDRLELSENILDSVPVDGSKVTEVISQFDPGIEYIVKLLSYEDIIIQADKILNGYVPEEDIRNLYSIN